MSKYELIYGPKRAHYLYKDDVYTKLGDYKGSDGNYYNVYHKFNQICPSCKNTLYESAHHQCCFKNCGVWNYLGFILSYLKITFHYDKPSDLFWVRKENLNHHDSMNIDKKLEHHFCNKCNYDFYTIEGF